MAYRLPSLPAELTVSQDFDRCEGYLKAGQVHELRAACEEILGGAVTECRGASVHGPLRDASVAALFLGLIELRESRFEPACEHFTSVLHASRTVRVRASAGLGRALIGAGRRGEACALLSQALDEFPESSEIFGALSAYYRGGDNQPDDGAAAWAHLVRAARCNPSDGAVIAELVSIGFVPERYAELADALRAYVVREPMVLDYRACLGMALLLLGRIDEAQEELERVDAFAACAAMDPSVLATARETLHRLREG